MPIIANAAFDRLRAGKTSIGFGVSHLRTVAAPALAKTAGFDWLFIDCEHGSMTSTRAAQLSAAALAVGITPSCACRG